MTLEDFFTLSEMNSGLTAPSRVRELMTVMQNQRDCIVKNAGDSTRQRSAVVSALAATENKDCLDLFIQLDGLHFISSWLKDAQKLSNDSSDSFLEESIFHLLRALEKLRLDYEESLAFEIRATVEILIEHKSSNVQDKARVLLESWNSDANKAIALTDDKTRKNSDDDNGHELARDDQVRSTSLDAVHPEQVESALEPNKISDPATEDEKPVDHVSSSPSLPKPSIEPSGHDSSGQDIIYTNSDIHGLKSRASEGQPFTSSSDAVVGMEDVTKQSSQKNSNAGSKNLCVEDSSKIEFDGKSCGDANSCRNSMANTPKEHGDVNGHVLPKSLNGEKSWGNFLSGIKDSLSNEGLTNDYAFGKKQINMESNSTAKNSAGVKVDYGVVDPLDVAMHVAMEVERETVDFRPHSCSTSPKKVTENQPNSSVSGKQSQSNSSNEPSNGSENLSPQEIATSEPPEAAQEEEANAEKTKSPCNFFDLNQEVFSEDLDHHHHPGIQPSAPVSVVSASRASAADPRLPCVPLQFEGNLGWKGSALTSAFRRVPESDFSNGGNSSNNSKQKQGGFLDFDLNVTENVDELSVETNSKRSELDLNCITGDGRSQPQHLDWRIGSQFPSLNQYPTRNIDLNDDGPLFLTPKKTTSQNDSAISIMGTRVEVNRKDFASQTQTPEVAKMGNFMGVGSTVPYVHSLSYGYGGNFTPGPAMPFSGPTFGPARAIPYMVDSRGMPVIPHTVSGQGLPAAFGQQPFVVGPMPLNGTSFDLNSGMVLEGGNKDPAGVGLFLNSAHGAGLQPMMSSGVGGKRKEPEGGYSDHYYPVKHYTPPPWKQS